jgi:hypothetical protein
LLGDHFEIGLGQNAFELAQHERVWREQADGELGRIGALSSHRCQGSENWPNGQEGWNELFTN